MKENKRTPPWLKGYGIGCGCKNLVYLTYLCFDVLKDLNTKIEVFITNEKEKGRRKDKIESKKIVEKRVDGDF